MLVPRPLPGAQPNWGNPLTVGLRGLWLFNEGAGQPRGILPGTMTTSLATTPAWVPGASRTRGGGTPYQQSGPRYAHTATADGLSLGVAGDLLPDHKCTIVLAYRKRDTTNRASAAFSVNDATASTRCLVHLPYSDGTVYWDWGGSIPGSTRLNVAGLTFGDDVWVFTSGNRAQEIWQNGLLRATQASIEFRSVSAAQFQLGTTTLAASDIAEYSFLGIWHRQLSQTEIKQVSADPYRIFRSSIPRDALTVAGGGGGGGGGGGSSRLLLLGVG